MRKESRNEISETGLWILYVLSLLVVWLNVHFNLSKIYIYQSEFLFVPANVARAVNLIFLVLNALLIRRIFTVRDRNILGVFPMFVYLLFHNKWWLFDTINNYLISDFFILVSLYAIGSRETKHKINIFVFYLAGFFGAGFLSGINFVYSFIIPVFIFNLFLLSDWKSWIIFILGFLMPIYFFVTINWLSDNNPFLYLEILLQHSFYRLGTFSLKEFSFTEEWKWVNTSIVVSIVLLFLSGLQELRDVGFYSGRERRIALFFFFLMFFSLINYFLIYFVYSKNALSVIALPYAYYLGHLLNKVTGKLKYFILFLIFLLTVFL